MTKIKASKEAGEFPVDHYSHSSMMRFSTNPILFKIQDINKDSFDTARGISGIIGQAFHKAMEAYYGNNDDKEMAIDEAEAVELGLKTAMEFLDKYNENFIQYSKTIPNKQKALELLAFTYNSYVQLKPNKKSGEELIACEEMLNHKINVEWNGKALNLPVPIKGYTDKIVREDGKLKIKDYKTTRAFSDPEKIDGAKILQAINYYLLTYAEYGEEPYSMTFEEIKMTKNSDGTPQLREYEMVYGENELYFDFYFRFYEDMTRALNGEMVYVPNINAFYDNEVAIISYIHRLDVSEDQAKLMKKHKVSNITDLLKKKIQGAGNMRKLLKTVEEKFISAKNLNYSKMENQEKIQTKMLEYGMMLQFDSKIEGATVDQYRYTPSIGLKMSKLKAYLEDVEQVLGVSGIRVLAPIPNTSLVGYEVPKKDRVFPSLPKGKGFDIAIGENIMGEPHRFDIRQAPHMLVAGASGSGKSVFLTSVIDQLTRMPKKDVQIHLYDPKMVELALFEDNKNVVDYQTDIVVINESLKDIVREMNSRYKKLSGAKVRNIEEYNGSMPYKFIVIDEFGDLTMQNYIQEDEDGKKNISEEISKNILLLAQKARAAGIHIIISTQRPSTDVVTGTIKANFPTKVAFRTAKGVDSVVVLDETGAEMLMGKGDMIFASADGSVRLQGYLKF